MSKLKNSVLLGLAFVVQGLPTSDVRREEGQTLAEYALILALIAVGVIAAVIFLRGSISSLFNNVGSSI